MAINSEETISSKSFLRKHVTTQFHACFSSYIRHMYYSWTFKSAPVFSMLSKHTKEFTSQSQFSHYIQNDFFLSTSP